MKVAIVGAGKLGITIAETLYSGGNDVTIIDKDEDLLQKVSSRLDILAICANAKREDVLRDEIGVGNYDILIAATDSDERNMVICSFAKNLGCPRVICRVRSAEHVEQFAFIKKCLNIDYIVNPDMACAEEINKYLTERYTLDNGIYSADGFSLLEFEIEKMPVLIGKSIRDIPSIIENILVVAVSKDGKLVVPTGSTELSTGDVLYVIGLDKRITELQKRVRKREKDNTGVKRVMIAGGGGTGFFLAKTLESDGVSVKIIENDRERCEYLSQKLGDVLILHGDATDLSLLQEENLDAMDAFVAATGLDEENLLLSLIAKRHGIDDVVAKVSRNSYESLTDNLGVSMVINPVDMCASNILRYVQKDKVLVFSKIIQGQGEFVEIRAEDNMRITTGTLAEIEIPQGILIAAVMRRGELIIPNGHTRIQTGDRVLIISLLSSLPMLESLLNKSRII